MENNSLKQKEITLLKLAKVAEAGRALAIAADALKMDPEEITGIVVGLAKKELSEDEAYQRNTQS